MLREAVSELGLVSFNLAEVIEEGLGLGGLCNICCCVSWMETDVRERMIVKGGVTLGVNGMESPKTVLLKASEEEPEEEDMECYLLLATEMRRGGMARRCGDKRRLSVQWSDTNGNKLAEILEFQPSDISDSEEDESDACFCCIM